MEVNDMRVIVTQKQKEQGSSDLVLMRVYFIKSLLLNKIFTYNFDKE